MKNSLYIILLLINIMTCRAVVPKLTSKNIEKIISSMTLEEKVDLIVGRGMYLKDDNAPEYIKESLKIVPGAAGRVNPIPRVGIPCVVLSDGPAGCGIEAVEGEENHYCTHFPIETLLASTWNTELVQNVGKAIGEESKEYGVDILLAPAINIHRNPLCGRNFEYFSEDPLLAGKMAVAYVNGVQSNGIGTSVKHFAGNNQETNRMNNNAIISKRALREIYLKAFEIVVKESKPWTIMTSYNHINDVYTSENAELITNILRNEWGFKGAVMTDWWGGLDVVAQLTAGNNMLEPGTKEQAEQIIKSVKDGKLSEDVVNDNVRYILNLIVKTPRFNQYKYSNNPDMDSHAAITRKSATEGMVLLKNDNNALPINKNNVTKVALFGTVSYNFFSGGTGSGDINRPYVVSLLDGLKNQDFVVDENLKNIYQSYSKPQEHGIQKRIDEMPLDTAIINYSVNDNDMAIITIGRISGEYIDRVSSDFFLSEGEYNLIKNVSAIYHQAKKKVVVVLNVGGVIETKSWKDIPDAVLLSWQAGQEGGNSVVDILTGEANPSGKLPMTFPITLSDHLSTINFPVDQKIDRRWSLKFPLSDNVKNVDYTSYDEGIYVGYRWFDTKDIPVSFPFGFGLSYTTFEYGKPSIENKEDVISVSVAITNTGKIAGKEVAQLYVEAPESKLDKPSHELKAFVKTKLLQPGETQVVELKLKLDDLSSFDESIDAWVTDAGTYKFIVSSSSRDPKGVVSMNINQSVRKVENVMNVPNRFAKKKIGIL
jgi:beta-glucosidase